MTSSSLSPSSLSLALFFTYGVSLRSWDEVGLFEREIALYRHLKGCGINITFVTYGDSTDLGYQERMPGIRICCNRFKLRADLYGKLIPWLHAGVLRSCTLFKTNQMNGAEYALNAARRLNKPLVARCGYLWSKNMILEHGSGSLQAKRSLEIEKLVFSSSQQIIVTTPLMRESVANHFPTLNSRIDVIPNYVDVSLFTARRMPVAGKDRFCFVGRLTPEKNIDALIAATAGLDAELQIVGQGPLESKLKQLAAGNANIIFTSRIPNEELPGLFARCTGFVLPSFYEGHPKAMIEAMACGMPVIGSDVPGINDVITHGVTGLLCGTEADSIRSAIRMVTTDAGLRERLGNAARDHALQHYSLEHVAAAELALYKQFLAGEGF
jgi:glycosyltransferase involved in cell wall biosynthesis